MVTLFATVRDKTGAFVKGLTGEDFLLEEDGVPQNIRYFSRESDLPLAIGLLIDTSRSQTGVLESERRASYTFLDRVLHEDRDKAFVVQFDEKVEVLQGFTSSRQELARALSQLRTPGRFATLLYDAIRNSSENLMRRQRGRKAFVLLSDGVQFRGETSIETAIEYAQRADIMIFSIRFPDHIRMYRPGRAALRAVTSEHGKKVLRRLSEETGGEFFEVSKDQTIEQIYAQIENLLRNQYSLGYTPERAGATGQYHKLRLRTKQPGLLVRTRAGYYSS